MGGAAGAGMGAGAGAGAGAAAGAAPLMSNTQKMFAGMGQGMFQQGGKVSDTMLQKLAAMGPPPSVQMPQMQGGVGADMIGQQYQQAMQGVMAKPPNMTKTRGENQTMPIGAFLPGGGY